MNPHEDLIPLNELETHNLTQCRNLDMYPKIYNTTS